MNTATLRSLLVSFLLAVLGGCGGGGGGSNSSSNNPPPAFSANEHPIRVSFGIGNIANAPYTSVTICEPGNAGRCQTIDNILVDTGSSGLRIMESALSPNLNLTFLVDNASNLLGECVGFADGSKVWGPVRLADVRLADQTASSISIHTIGTNNLPAIPAGCAGTFKNDPLSFGANGVLGIGPKQNDCGPACEFNAFNGQYYFCDNQGVCTGTTLSGAFQVSQPIASFPAHNNGSLITLPAAPLNGAVSLNGKLTLGIGTAGNNAIGNARLFPIALDPQAGVYAFTTRYKNVDYAGFIDSGSNGIFIPDNSLPLCGGGSSFFCPAAPQILSAINFGTNGLTDTVSFTVVSANTSDPGFAVLPGLVGREVLGAVDFGLPFFYGRSVFTAIENRTTPAGNGPFFAY